MDEVGGVGGVGRAVGLEHLFAVPVVGGDEGLSAFFQEGIEDTTGAGIDGFDGPDRGGEDPGMTDHIGVGEVEDDEVIEAFLDPIDHLVGERDGAHLGLEVVGGDLGRRSHDTLLAGVGCLLAAVEEVGDVGVFLRLGHPGLLEAPGGDDLTEQVVHLHR